MALYWKDHEIVPGMMLEVDLADFNEVNEAGYRIVVSWEILFFDSRKEDEAYLQYPNRKKYPLGKVLKSRRLQAALSKGLLLQLPPGREFMAVREFHDGKEASFRCCSLDLLGSVRNLRVLHGPPPGV